MHTQFEMESSGQDSVQEAEVAPHIPIISIAHASECDKTRQEQSGKGKWRTVGNYAKGEVV